MRVALPAVTLASGQVYCRAAGAARCFSDFEDGKTRSLGFMADSSSSMKQEDCAATCYRLGKELSGVEYQQQCFCGNSVAARAEARPMDECQKMACPGNATQSCGDANRILVYNTTCTGERTPLFHGCQAPEARGLPYCDTSRFQEERVEDLVGRMTLEEKVQVIAPQKDLGGTCACHTRGVPRLGLPNWSWLTETNTAVAAACVGPEKCATTFSGPLGMGASFNRSSWRLKGSVLGTETRAFSNLGWHRGNPGDFVTLTGYGPNINILRDPRFGRASELPGEDPLHSGLYAYEMVSGMQERDAAGYPKMLAFLKHFTGYSVETNRGHDNYDVSPHDMWDTYLRQYALAFEAQPMGVMCSYNALNGAPSCANDFILNKVMRGMWKKDALVTTDCGAVSNLRGPPVNAPSDAAAAAMTINNGTDIEMGSTLFNSSLMAAVEQGLTTEAAVSQAVKRALRTHFEGGRFDPENATSWSKIGLEAVNSSLHQQIQYEAALQSFVLLKNGADEGGRVALPITPGQKVAVLGPQGMTTSGLLSDYAGDQQCYGGTTDCWPTIAEAISAANIPGSTTMAKGVNVADQDASGIPAALALAEQAEVVVLVMGNDRTQEHEGIDRKDTALPGLQESFVKQVLAKGKPTVLVLTNGGALAIDNLVSRPEDASYALVEAFNPSVAGPRALAATLLGMENRWGRLPYTMYPHSYVQEQAMTNFDMAKAPGRTYRYYTGTPLFEFGAGLSYTRFSLSCARKGQGYQRFRVECHAQNTGAVDGDLVVLAFHAADGIGKVDHPVPLRALRNFTRVSLQAGEASNSVGFDFTSDDLALINAEGKATLYPGTHHISLRAGGSVQEMSTTFAIQVPETVVV
mmetsp:Transcript_19145/g.48555  ORF Transcript_19145/g.48555 Transcript_19145/m.48555 type:complete len:862 (+) Transcript_19145:48-2633(+)